MRRPLAVLAAVPLLFAAACGTDKGTGAGTATNASSSAIKVTGEAGKQPQVTFPGGKPATTSSVNMVSEGQGTPFKKGDSVISNLTVFDWDGKSNTMAGSTYSAKPELIKVDDKLPKVLFDAFHKVKPGGRFVAVVAPGDSYTKQDLEQAKQQGIDVSVPKVFVFDPVSVVTPKISGTAGDPGVKGITLESPEGAAPKLTTKTDAPAPKELVNKTVIEGKGPKVEKGQTAVVQYTGKIWGSDREFDSSWSKGGEPVSFPIGVGQVIKGWDQTIVGAKVGSRLLVSIPPDLGYGKQGQPQAQIKGTDTLVFVVDVLGAY
ncbi:peptidylprolyl isomerase [Sinosporangium album]|uniref:Peptidyl-prolyl cis-trans isomerase n=1 Tax=Sinosporangium album TaxID=504805 RepID=A0A1G8I655_9ACTN|nr:FKBP-type peptidyl-prolyl cis-trans isomerase [Sinosporangium album]SDI14080.1 peptidylprolyl isomerase [Sinosporangium album]